MTSTLPQLILASSSRYRKDLLGRLHIPFECISPNIDETKLASETPVALSIRLAKEKAQVVFDQYKDSVVIGSDQVATFNNKVMGKAGSLDKAKLQLKELSGQQVDFYTSLCILHKDGIMRDTILTRCIFRDLSIEEIENYLSIEPAFDTAGSAKAEGLGISLMESITSDDPTAIIGLPLIRTSQFLRELGFKPQVV
ncbi:Maf family protein [Taylorella equigenitalis]|uniref:7-methyl-GTP pyrophosphatase n=2 Tax=Taylorella equigenitalis TaxID=29575 RepID=A0A654KHU0_TAYEM|nr:Maf family nucleotide pyrophosphatase [Taylorella equigenitalis]ADU92017.1 Maf/YceF/YhdE family protein [Taylorella equigenitalis MCE9]AFN35579.1 MAF-like protein [Taylorella equigenitalis ATCC 35865]ASY39005.1 septum formation protein Maf [Taylorella equigenitalis]ASY40524.1 septum formation protein Maf [Taylorella equigenitalis]WDU56785.1 septum formation protein Maf [Taylorella equigenitalis]